jgi:hypothetical protein
VLFSFPSQYYFAIGLKTCLELPVNAWRFHAPFPRNVTLDTRNRTFFVLLLGYHHLWLIVPDQFRLED